MTKKKSEVGNLPGYSSLGEIQKDLIDRLITGFKDSREFLDWKQDLTHSSFGDEDAVKEITVLTKEDFQDMYISQEEPHKRFFREHVANYLIRSVFPTPQRFFAHRAREDPTGEKKGMFKEEADPFEGGL
jgi:hypothetical protein